MQLLKAQDEDDWEEEEEWDEDEWEEGEEDE
ncbi:TPA: pyruvate dehydrogenase [Candidatus Micrarchaeota archaeon]|nr:pyruvate dehydrogenase [Candidatus Micrarchaeota archaeon]